MFIDKIYNVNEMTDNEFLSIMSFKDYDRIILTKIIYDCNIIRKNVKFQPIIYVGSAILNLLCDQDNFFSATNDIILENNFTGLAGYLNGKNVYYDTRLEYDKVIVGSDYWEIQKFINTKGRKEKLLKINNKIGRAHV